MYILQKHGTMKRRVEDLGPVYTWRTIHRRKVDNNCTQNSGQHFLAV